MMLSDTNTSKYLECEHRVIFLLLISAAGMMGAYTFNMRGGIFCNAQTANVVMMSMALGKGEWLSAAYFLIPITAYMSGALISEALSPTIKKQRFIRWDTWLILIECFIMVGIGFIPLSWPDQIVQVTINFIAAMQYNTFRQAEGIPVATTFCTNHVRQIGVAIAKVAFNHDYSVVPRMLLHLKMLCCFFGGGVALTYLCRYLGERAIWVSLLPLGIVFVKLLHADLTKEKDQLSRKPAGH